MPTSVRNRRKRNKIGRGFVNSIINKLPFEAHIPGYQFCGPGTKLKKRLALNQRGINPLDSSCLAHDLQYSKKTDNLVARHKADKQLEYAAWDRFKAKDSSFGEKAAALLVTNIMKTKRRFGMGCDVNTSIKKRKKQTRKKKKMSNNRKIAFGAGVVRKVRDVLRKAGGDRFIAKDGKKASEIALHAARKYLKAAGGKKKIRTPRIIPIPKVGGILPLIPIFAGLSALGSLSGAAAGIARAINSVTESRNGLKEVQLHNRKMEAIALGKKGSGIFLKPYRKGLGIYLKPQSSKN